MKIVYIFGAGVSASIDERVPVMANFFEKAIDMLNEDNKSFQIAFAFAEEARAFPPNPEIENLGIQMSILGRLSEELKTGSRDRSGENPINIRLTEAIHDYKKTFKNDINRISANLEDVFSNVEAFKEKSTAADQTYARLQYVINGLFNQLDKELQDKFSVAAHHDLSQFVANTDKLEHTFISFNYDLWLEKALFQKQVWLPRDGHGTYCFKYYSQPVDDIIGVVRVPEAKKFTSENQRSRIKVLKPHGSLSWRFGNKNRENGVVILENKEGSCVEYNNTWYLPATHFPRGTELTLIPLIAPPIPNKVRSHPLFWATDKDVYNALLHADIVVIVGWSMPLTDRYLQDTILRALNNREEQIKKLVVCDKQESDGQLLSRFESIFKPHEIKSWLDGFRSEFVDFLKEKL